LKVVIRKVERCNDLVNMDKTINKFLSNNVTIKFYILGSLMKSEILSNVNSKSVVIKGSVESG